MVCKVPNSRGDAMISTELLIIKLLAKVALANGIVLNCHKCKHYQVAICDSPCEDCDAYDSKFELEETNELKR